MDQSDQDSKTKKFIKIILSEYHTLLINRIKNRIIINLFLNIITVYIENFRRGKTSGQNLKELGVKSNCSSYSLTDVIKSSSTCDNWITILSLKKIIWILR